MLKYLDCKVVFAEVPDEISLAIEITNCPFHCPGCHSPQLWEDIGQELTEAAIEDLLISNRGITCVCFMGGDIDGAQVNRLSKWVHKHYGNSIKTAWYSGADSYPTFLPDFDYIKIGSYRETDGPIDVRTTNQKMVKIHRTDNNWYMEDITYKFWKDDKNS